jgi:hypothetical protein
MCNMLFFALNIPDDRTVPMLSVRQPAAAQKINRHMSFVSRLQLFIHYFGLPNSKCRSVGTIDHQLS